MYQSVDQLEEELAKPGACPLTPEEIDLMKRVERSRMWRLIRDALCLEREQLFAGNSSISGLAGQPSTSEALWTNRGAILLIQHLLQEGPWFVVKYTRYMVEQQEQKARQKATTRMDREYQPGNGLDERPEFDI